MRAHLTGFTASPRENIRLVAAAPVSFRLQLHHLEEPVATTGVLDPLAARPIVAAGFSLPAAEPASDAQPSDDDHSHTDTAWRLRHLTRSILKDSASTVPVESR